jgi:hypothetical protein
MPWQSIGSLSPSLGEWQLLPVPTLGDVYRVSFLGDISRKRTFLRVRQYFSSDEVSPSIKLHLKQEKAIFELPIPQALRDSGLVVRYLGVAKFPYNWGVMNDSLWSIEIEEFVP